MSDELVKSLRKASKLCDGAIVENDEVDFWKNRTREALETIKDNVARIAELRRLVARIVELNDIDSDVADYIRWEKLVADARKSLEYDAADWEAAYRSLGEKDNA